MKFLITCLLCACVALLIAYGTLGYLAFAYYPDKMSQEEGKQAGLLAALEEVKGDQRLLRQQIRKRTGEGNAKQQLGRAEVERILKDKSVLRLLDKYLGGKVISKIEETTRSFGEWDVFERDVENLRRRKKHMMTDFAGPVGRDSASWTSKEAQLTQKLETLEADRRKLQGRHDQALGQLRAIITDLRGGISYVQNEVERRKNVLSQLKEMRTACLVWPFSALVESSQGEVLQ